MESSQIILAYIKDLSYISLKSAVNCFDVVLCHRILTECVVHQGTRVGFQSRCEGTSRPAEVSHSLIVRLPKFNSSSCLIHRLICPAWKLSRLQRTDVCLTELSGAYDRSFKGLDTAKAYRFRGNAKSAFNIRCDFRFEVACPAIACSFYVSFFVT